MHTKQLSNLPVILASYLLLFVFMYNTVLFVIVNEIAICIYKQHGKEISKSENFEDAELIVLRKTDITKNNIAFKWIEQHEFRLNGEMYDVIRQSEDEEFYYFYCYHDIKEEKITEEYYNKSETGTLKNNNIIQIRNTIFTYISEPAGEHSVGFSLNALEPSVKVESRAPVNFDREVPTPPPRFTIS